MNKKEVFKNLILEFIGQPIDTTKPRALEIPIDTPKIISLVGARRTGKTHIMYHIINELRKTVAPDRLVYINFEDDRLFPLKLEDMDLLVQAYYELYPTNREVQAWFFFDEIQEVDNWEKFVRRLWDTERCRIYITGSSSRLLTRELAYALRGRTLPYEVFPLDFSEFLQFNDINLPDQYSPKDKAVALHWFDKWLAQGGFPELVFLQENLHRKLINEYLDLMLYRDLSVRFSVKQPAMLKYLLKFFLQNLANPLSLTKVYNDLKSQGFTIAKNTVFDYVSHMEEAYVLFKTDIWHRSVRVQSVNPSKYYCVDPAFKYAMSISEDRGRVLENAVFLHLRRQGLTPHYFLEKQEVDFFWENGYPINVCYDFYDQVTQEREIKGMTAALKFLDLKDGLILTRDKTADIKVDNKTIRVEPAWKYFLENR